MSAVAFQVYQLIACGSLVDDAATLVLYTILAPLSHKLDSLIM